MAVSHGKGGTPMFYSSLMMHFAGKGYRAGAVQHSEKFRIGMKTKPDVKKYRSAEVKVRAKEYI